MRKKAVCFHRSVAENQRSLNSALRAVDLEDRAVGLSPGKPGFKHAADISQGIPNLRIGQAHSDRMAEPATVYREECDFLPSARLVILPAMSKAPWQGHSFGMRCVLCSGLFPEVVFGFAQQLFSI